jgi:hypothetical protein
MGENEEENDAERILHEVKMRQISRDQHRLRYTKMSAMNLMTDNFREWIFQETKDLLIVIEILKKAKLKGITDELTIHETRIKQIQKSYSKKIILPMRHLERGGSGAKHEEEHCRKFRIALDNAFGLILELRSIRQVLDTFVLAFASFGVAQEATGEGEASKYVT